MQRTQRLLEIGTGSLTWVLLTSPLWGAIVAPRYLVYCLLLFNVYWVYKSANTAIFALLGYRRLMSGQKTDWLSAVQSVAGWDRTQHLVLIPTYREPPEVLEVMLDHLAAQDFPLANVSVVLAFEDRDPGARACAARLVAQFEDAFLNLWVTYHPDHEGELRGKSSNLAYAARCAKRALVDEQGIDMQDVLVTICDADSRLHPKYLSALTYGFLRNPNRRYAIWQPALLFYSNIWRIPAIARIGAGLYSVWQLSRLVARYKLVTQSTYSLALSTCHRVGYWDVDVIPEDSRMFFKIFFALGHEHEVTVEPIFLPVLADAAEGSGFWKTIANHYRQTRRWAWGVSDVPYVMTRAFQQTAVPLWARLRRAGFYTEEHICWPTHWFLLTIGANLVALLAPSTPQTASTIAAAWASGWLLTLCLPCLGVVIFLDQRLRPARPRPVGWWVDVVGLAIWALIPVVGLVLTALPALDAHTRLLFGRYLHYQVTEKLPAERTYTAPSWTDGASSAGAA
ncbi:MAG: glycosyltransferase family 2 protein [Chloroflexi bacterium]|nr:glycosyltransferase family 2 protein [Chloroflexota bacterium]